MFYDFGDNYRMVSEKLYIFDYLADGIVGFMFYDKEDADAMYRKIKSVAPKVSEFQEIQKGKI